MSRKPSPLKTARVVRAVSTTAKWPTCFSRSGWWQTLCGLDAACQGFGWRSDPAHVGCKECLALIAKGEHLTRPVEAYMRPKD